MGTKGYLLKEVGIYHSCKKKSPFAILAHRPEALDIQEIATLEIAHRSSCYGGWWNRGHFINLFKMAAANGNSEAQAILGNMYMNGKEVEVESAL
ncbi:hypothetical protein HDU99_004484 [Rhizoclosmatium hyalinum]|nr:hypothetical protein HDU99_004484 [Rhizoclosmatium hyalinum]